jgi:chemotaxis family two-component system sensor kinase Cph1
LGSTARRRMAKRLSQFEPQSEEVTGLNSKPRGESEAEQIAAMNAAIKQAKDDFAQFAYIAAHNLKEPVRSVSISAERLRRDPESHLSAEGAEYLQQILGGIHRMGDLLDDLFAYSQLDAFPLNPSPVRMIVVVNEAMHALQPQIQQTGAKITHDALPVVSGDQMQLTKVMENLLSNSLKFRSEEAPEIHIGCAPDDSGVRFSVQDNGIGVEPAYADSIFKLFKRLHSREKYPGNGIGLALCRGMVERHGGKIWAEPKAGKGTTVCFTLPETSPNHKRGS